MSTAAPMPPKKSPPPPPPSNGAKAQPAATRQTFGIGRGAIGKTHKVVIYGPGGIGKTTLASLAPKPLFIDLEGGTVFMDVNRVTPTPATWDDLRACLHSEELFHDARTVVVDSLSRVEELCVRWVLANVPTDKGAVAPSLEHYGWGKGYAIVAETFRLFLADLDQHAIAGRHVVCICHDEVTKAPNPSGEDWLRYEPRLQNRSNGNIRAEVKEWASHVLHVAFDVVAKDGKGKGGGTRTIYPEERPDRIAKSRTLRDPIVFTEGSRELWDLLEASTNG